MAKKAGFGKAGEHDFYVVIPGKHENDTVQIIERYFWPSDDDRRLDILRLELPRERWDLVSKGISDEFNRRLKAEKQPSGRFTIGGNPVERDLGKEMMVLLWGIEHCDLDTIPAAIRNWRGLNPVERLWLYNMTNATAGQIYDDKGWRKALRYALCENPISE